MSTKAVRRVSSIYLAHLSGVAVGVALTVAATGFAFGVAMPYECSAALTGWINQQ